MVNRTVVAMHVHVHVHTCAQRSKLKRCVKLIAASSLASSKINKRVAPPRLQVHLFREIGDGRKKLGTVTENRWTGLASARPCRVFLYGFFVQTVLESLYMRWTPLVGTQDGTRLHVHLTKTSPGYLIRESGVRGRGRAATRAPPSSPRARP